MDPERMILIDWCNRLERERDAARAEAAQLKELIRSWQAAKEEEKRQTWSNAGTDAGLMKAHRAVQEAEYALHALAAPSDAPGREG